MQFEKLDRVAMTVKDLDQAMRDFTDLFGVTFKARENKVLGATVALSDQGFELVARHSPAGPQAERLTGDSPVTVVIKVTDIEEAKRSLEERGVRLLFEAEVGQIREIIVDPRDFHGIRLALCQYPTGSLIKARGEGTSTVRRFQDK